MACTDRNQDISDAQYSSFRGSVPYLAILLIFHPILRNIYNSLRPVPSRNNSPKPNGNSSYVSAADGDARLEQRAWFDFGFALIFLAALHGFSALKVLSLLYINYQIATRLPRKFVPVATWTFNIATLFANELSDGYKFEKMAAYISPLEGGMLASESLLHSWGGWLDSYGGFISRWEILFNITVLRQISFNLDYYWSLDRRSGSPIEVGSRILSPSVPIANAPKKKQLDPSNLSERDRIATPASTKDYSFRNYVAYAIYAPPIPHRSNHNLQRLRLSAQIPTRQHREVSHNQIWHPIPTLSSRNGARSPLRLLRCHLKRRPELVRLHSSPTLSPLLLQPPRSLA